MARTSARATRFQSEMEAGDLRRSLQGGSVPQPCALSAIGRRVNSLTKRGKARGRSACREARATLSCLTCGSLVAQIGQIPTRPSAGDKIPQKHGPTDFYTALDGACRSGILFLRCHLSANGYNSIFLQSSSLWIFPGGDSLHDFRTPERLFFQLFTS